MKDMYRRARIAWKYNSLLPIFMQRFFLWLALGSHTYGYMKRTLAFDRRLSRCKLADIVVRQDGKEVRIEADWLKNMAKICIKQPPKVKSAPIKKEWISSKRLAIIGDEAEQFENN